VSCSERGRSGSAGPYCPRWTPVRRSPVVGQISCQGRGRARSAPCRGIVTRARCGRPRVVAVSRGLQPASSPEARKAERPRLPAHGVAPCAAAASRLRRERETRGADATCRLPARSGNPGQNSQYWEYSAHTFPGNKNHPTFSLYLTGRYSGIALAHSRFHHRRPLCRHVRTRLKGTIWQPHVLFAGFVTLP
jgi:hypothetical protein